MSISNCFLKLSDYLQYANWLSKTPSEGVFDAAARLALSCFNEAASKFGQNSEISFEMAVSPFTESVSALRNILSWAPTRFANADALSTLESKLKAQRLRYISISIYQLTVLF